MTQEDVIEMADKADAEADKVLNMKGEYHPNWHQVRDEIFAKLVEAKEREACAKVCEEDLRDEYLRQGRPVQDEVNLLAAIADCAEAIRARGEA